MVAGGNTPGTHAEKAAHPGRGAGSEAVPMMRAARRGMTGHVFPHPCRGALLFHPVPGVIPPAKIRYPSGVTEASALFLYTLSG